MIATDQYLTRAIVQEPDDVELRLLYADLLEERGDPRGEFIRVQCELAACPATCECGGYYCDQQCRPQRLHRRERELLEGHGYGWCDVPDLNTCGVSKENCTVIVNYGSYGDNRFEMTFAGGFIEVVHCRLEDWCGRECRDCDGKSPRVDPWCDTCHGTGRVNAHGPAIRTACPIRRVEFSDEPNEHGLVKHGIVRGATRDAISGAAIAWARKEAEL